MSRLCGVFAGIQKRLRSLTMQNGNTASKDCLTNFNILLNAKGSAVVPPELCSSQLKTEFRRKCIFKEVSLQIKFCTLDCNKNT